MSIINYIDSMIDEIVTMNLLNDPHFITNDTLQNKYNLMYLFYIDKLIPNEDIYYIKDDRFKSLYITNRERLEEILVSYDIPNNNKTRIQLVKNIIDKKLYSVQKFCRASSYTVSTNTCLYSGGFNAHGQLGVGDGLTKDKPTRVQLEGVLWISCGYMHTMALTTDGLFAWGSNHYDQLGLGDKFKENSYNSPVRVQLNGVLSVSCEFMHTMALTTDGLFAWGANFSGQLGLGDEFNGNRYNAPKRVMLNGVLSVSCGWNFTIAITETGLYSWGDNSKGQLGRNKLINENTPGNVYFFEIGKIDVLSVSCGESHVIALTTDGLYAWGSNYFGQLGVDADIAPVPKKVQIEGVISVSCGKHHTAALTADGLFMWGSNLYGELGINTNIQNSRIYRPKRVNLNGVLWVSCGGSNTLVMTTNGLYAWGEWSEYIPEKILLDGVITSLLSTPYDFRKSFYSVMIKNGGIDTKDELPINITQLPLEIQLIIMSKI